MKNWPVFNELKIPDFMKFIVRERSNDVSEFNSLAEKFVSGRKVGKIPASSADVDPTDRIGDVNWDANYLYILVDNTGAVWRRATLGSW